MSWQNEALAFAAALLLAWELVRNARQGKIATVKLPHLALVPMVFTLIAALQWAAGMLTFGGEVFVIYCYALLCSLCVSIGYAQGITDKTESDRSAATPLIEPLSWSLLLAAMASVFILLTQNFMIDGAALWVTNTDNYSRPGSHLGQPNHAATLQVLGMASAIFLQARGRFSNFTTAALLLLFGIGMAVTQSRTSILSLGALLLWWTWKQPQIAPRTPRWTAAAISALIVALFMVWRHLFNSFHMMGSGGAQIRGLSDIRTEIWRQLIQAVWQKPWLGWGINQTASAHNTIADRYPSVGDATYSHNLILDMALWVGLPLTALLLLLTGMWVWRRARATKSLLPWYGLALALPVAVHSMLEYPFAYAYFLVPAMLGLGLTERALGERSLRLPLKAAAAILLISTITMIWAALEYIRAEEDFRVVRFETVRIGQTPVAYEPPKIVLLTHVGALLKAFRLPITQNMPTNDLSLLRAVASQNAIAAMNARYALALALNGQRVEAERQLAVIRAQYGEQNYLASCLPMHEALSAQKMDWNPDCSLQAQSAK